MGAEKQFCRLLRDVHGGKPINRMEGRLGKGPPNHKALREACNYASGDQSSALYLLDVQERDGLHAWGAVNEFGSTSHCAWWQAATASVWFFAWKRKDQEVLTRIRKLHCQQWDVEGLCSTSRGQVVLPGGRSHLALDEKTGKPAADQRPQREQFRNLMAGGFINKAGSWWNALDRTGLFFLKQISLEERLLVAGSINGYPKLLDKLTVVKWGSGHLAYYDHYSGISPSWWASADYITGVEYYGIEPGTVKGAKGGDRPESIVLPAVPGKTETTVVG